MNAIMKPLRMVPGSVGLLLAIFSILFYVPTHAQIAIRGQINSYAAVTGLGDCDNKLTVQTTSGFQPGNVVLLIQMQGAEIDNAGNVTNFNSAGAYEKAVIANISNDTISFTKNLHIRSYNPGGKVQMVFVPQYDNVFVIGELTAAPWNGTTGGVLAFEATGTVELRANINVNGLGFRGGSITNDQGNNNCNFFSSYTSFNYPQTGADYIYYAYKGEGISAILPGRELGRGAQANGGGGGNDHNSGGGGGGNYGAGGIGGKNIEPNPILCKGDFPGFGGKSINQTARVFLGGGGGGGHTNNSTGKPGANGGGIIYIKADTLTGNGRIISANGLTADSGFQDGIGGGGGGGTIMLDIANINTQNLTIEAKGGNGGNANNAFSNGSNPENRCFGPGGGGGGGIIAIRGAFDPTEVNPAITGGEPGITFNSTASCNETNNEALPGDIGILLRSFPSALVPTGEFDPGIGCFTPTPVDYLYFKLQPQDNIVHLEWATAREKDNDYFSIERSENGKDFYEIARVSGKGTYSGVSTYTINDNNPLFGLSYYRIKQVDYDRKSAYTGIEPVRFSAGEMLLSVYPNPVQSQNDLNITLYSPVEGEATLRVYTLLGEEKYTATYGVTKGAQKLDLSMNNFTTGWYVIHLQIGNYYKVQKIKVVR